MKELKLYVFDSNPGPHHLTVDIVVAYNHEQAKKLLHEHLAKKYPHNPPSSELLEVYSIPEEPKLISDGEVYYLE